MTSLPTFQSSSFCAELENTLPPALSAALEALYQSYTYPIITVSRIGRLRFSANSQLLQRGNVADLLSRAAGTGGRGRSAEYASGLVREVS